METFRRILKHYIGLLMRRNFKAGEIESDAEIDAACDDLAEFINDRDEDGGRALFMPMSEPFELSTFIHHIHFRGWDLDLGQIDAIGPVFHSSFLDRTECEHFYIITKGGAQIRFDSIEREQLHQDRHILIDAWLDRNENDR